jgi:hypothetical protein
MSRIRKVREAKGKPAKGRPPSIFDVMCKRYAHLLQKGLVLVVDPSSGSRESMPGFVLVEDAAVVNSGTIQLDLKKPPHRRLHDLQTEMFAIVPAVDLIVTESIPPFMSGKGGGFRTQSVVQLHWSVGAILSAYDADLIQVPIQSWRSWVTKNVGEIGETYKKGDEVDALAMTATLYAHAGVPLRNLDDVMKVLRGESPYELEEV